MPINYFEYNNDFGLPEGAFRISPSQLYKFFDNTSQWYRENLLGEEPEFTGSTSSHLGTAIHAAAAMYFNTKNVDKQAIHAYINSLSVDIDKQLILDQVKPMTECLINNFLSRTSATHAELPIATEILPGIYAAGTADLVNVSSGTLWDYKTIGSLDTARIPTMFPRNYWFQQLAYAYILTKLGHTIKSINLVYITRSNTNRISETTGKPLKDYPSECHIVSMEVTNELLDMMHGILNVVAHSVQHWKEHPEHRYLLAQDFRLYVKSPAKLFK